MFLGNGFNGDRVLLHKEEGETLKFVAKKKGQLLKPLKILSRV
ncbi:hypothetical protein MFUM_940090 [Methylacidiphilum fumariolicum SolV]|uniref:Uncharacterized protein n=2 Tax=Candidatus Methylacidiphilum fumarolicum TaxID=591154 RepID=I0K146_METFB|nr:conserved protein of unknown function [Candidatus Methylacidiphilum fumarolicum]CCG93215.1 hypothetical protein MFUM_940090 [Methylacidiphilum fumariolicum SolV]